MPKPLKVIGRKVEAVDVKVRPAPIKIFKLKTRKTEESARAHKAIDMILHENVPVSVAMKVAGYKDNSARALSIKNTKIWEERVEAHMEQLRGHRDEILKHMRENYKQAPYAALSMTLDTITKQMQLLSGKATGRIGFELPDEDRNKIIDIIAINADPHP